MRSRVLADTLTALREAPFDPSRWSAALRGVATLCGASSAQLITFGQCEAPVLLTPGFTDHDLSLFASMGGSDPAVNKGAAAILKAPMLTPVAVHEYMSERDRAHDPLYQEFFEPRDGAYASFGVIAREDAAASAVSLLHHRSQGPLDTQGRRTLGRLLPHFQKAFQTQRTIEETAAAVLVDSLAALSQVAVLCAFDARIHAATPRAEDVLRHGPMLTVSAGRLRATNPASDAALQSAIRQAASWRKEVQGHVIALRASAGSLSRATVVPLPSGRGPATLQPLALIHIDVAAETPMLDVELAMRAFGLTRAEGEVAAALFRGEASVAIAAQRGCSIETVHSQVKAVLAKTGCARRAEIPRVLHPFKIP